MVFFFKVEDRGQHSTFAVCRRSAPPFLQLPISLNLPPVSPLEKVTPTASFDIEIGSAGAIDIVQNLRKISSGSLKQEVIMVV
jgi:hypothetical protein